MLLHCRTEVLQCIDCNQDAYIEQCVLVASALREFDVKPRTTVVGFSEYVITERWNMVARLAALNERTFNTTIQRGLGMMGMR